MGKLQMNRLLSMKALQKMNHLNEIEEFKEKNSNKYKSNLLSNEFSPVLSQKARVDLSIMTRVKCVQV